MKKFFVAFMALATLAMVGCKKGDDAGTAPTPPPTDPQEEIPQNIPTPAVGKMTFVVRVDKTFNEGICNTIGMIGGFCSYDAASAAIFTKVADTESWYAATLDATDAVTFGNSKLTIVAEDGTTKYDYEGVGGEYQILNGSEAYIQLGDDYGTANCLKLIEGADLSQKIVYVHIGSFKANPCVAKSSYTITLKMKYNGGEGTCPAISGSMNSWGVTNMTAAGTDEWTVTFDGQATYEFKFQSSDGNWSNEIMKYNADSAEWYKMGNFTLGEELNQTFDFSDENLYKWSYVPKPDVPAGSGTFTVTVDQPYAAGDSCIFTGNFDEKAWGDSDRKMTYNAESSSWSWTGDYPKNFEYKVIYNGNWAKGNNVVFDGTTFSASFEI